MNDCYFQGRLTRDPELRKTNNDKVVVNFGIAVNNRRGKGQEDDVVFLDMEAWDTGAQVIGEHFKKGDGIIVHASIKQDTWEKDGEKRSKLKFRVNKFEFPMGRKGEGAGAAPAAAKKKAAAADDSTPAGETDTTIPF